MAQHYDLLNTGAKARIRHAGGGVSRNAAMAKFGSTGTYEFAYRTGKDQITLLTVYPDMGFKCKKQKAILK